VNETTIEITNEKIENPRSSRPLPTPMEAVLLAVMAYETMRDPKRREEGFEVQELSRIIKRTEPRVRQLLYSLREKGYVNEVPRYVDKGGDVWDILGQGQGVEEVLKVVESIIRSPKGGVRKRWFLLGDPDEILRICKDVLSK